MANGTNTLGFGFDAAYGYGFDKPMYNPYGGSTQNDFRFYMDQGTKNFLGIDFLNPQTTTTPVNPPITTGGGGSFVGNFNAGGATVNRTGFQLPSTFMGLGFGDRGTGNKLTADTAAAATGGGFGSRFASNLSSPQAMAGIAQGVGGIIQGLVGRGKRRDAQIAAQSEYDKMLSEYRSLDTSNLYANVENQYSNLENTFEDLTVNQQQAQFEKQMFQQQQADIMQGLQGAAGGSGIAGLAQAMANQGQLQAQRASASIGLQESKINMLRAQEASRLQKLERTGAMQAEQLRLAGAERARGLEYMQTSTQLGMAQQDLAARNRAIAQANAALYGGIGSLVGTAASAAMGGITPGTLTQLFK